MARWSLKSWRRQRILERETLSDHLWQAAADLPVLTGLSDGELRRLKESCVLFLHEKQLQGAAGLELDDAMRVIVAAQACLPILNLGVEWFDGWVEVIVYPDEFVPQHEYVDEAGVVHVTRHPLSGEAWLNGPVILSWADIHDAWPDDGVNVVIHEFAHKLDMLNGDANGFPPLHDDMKRSDWAQVFSAAYDDFCAAVDKDQDAVAFDPYAAENPGEFFAVFSEAFFEVPNRLRQWYPDMYEQLKRFYRQDPAARLPR